MPVTHYIWDEVNDTLLMEKDEVGNTIAEYTHEPGQYGPLISQHRNGQTRYHNYDGLDASVDRRIRRGDRHVHLHHLRRDGGQVRCDHESLWVQGSAGVLR